MSVHIQLQHEYYDKLLGSQYDSPDHRIERQRRQLERLLKHAKGSVPFYRDRLAPVFNGGGAIDWDRWTELPILTRNDLLASREAMQSIALPLAQGRVFTDSTSGSTGPSVTVRRSELSAHFNAAVMFRTRSWYDLDWRRELYIWVEKATGAPVREEGPAWGPPWLSESVGRSYSVSRLADAAEVLNDLQTRQPRYLTTRPKNAQFLALQAKKAGVKIPLGAILGYSTGILAEERDDCLEAFGAPMIGQYASKEAQLIAVQCPTGNHYHVNDEAVLVEILDQEGRACPPGEVGRVVVTQLWNFAQPIIRYDQGDLASLGPDCECGRTLTVLDRIVGRTTQLFRFPDGTRVAPVVPERVLRSILNAQYWQLAQVEPFVIEVRYVPFDGGLLTEDGLSTIEEVVRQRTHPHVRVIFKAVSDLHRVEGGKFLSTVCELPSG
jgi:phenylacetate-CoA ligase